MNLLLINGSPKKSSSNTTIMLEALVKGMDTDYHDSPIINLSHVDSLDRIVIEIKKHTHIIIGFPLYGNAMPAGLLELLEFLNEDKLLLIGKHLGFMIQYGFPEAIHARPIEAYLKHWTLERKALYSGSIIRGGCDGLSKEKKNLENHEVIKGLIRIGQNYRHLGHFDSDLINSFAGVESHKKKKPYLLKIMIALMNQFYWKKLLKSNGVSEKESFAKPYRSNEIL